METGRAPNPGSDEAIKRGCKCPVEDNKHGKGTGTGITGDALYWYSSDCPIHCGGEKHDDEIQQFDTFTGI